MQTPRLRHLPREQWATHPHWPTQTLLLHSHAGFRHTSRRLVEQSHDERAQIWIPIVYPQWIAAMRSHEAYEEHKLYPFLARRWGLSFESAEAGHGRLHARDAEVRVALQNPGLGDGAALHDALAAHDETLRDHLDHEEELVIPALLELAPREFDDYTTLRLPELMRRLDALEAAHA